MHPKWIISQVCRQRNFEMRWRAKPSVLVKTGNQRQVQRGDLLAIVVGKYSVSDEIYGWTVEQMEPFAEDILNQTGEAWTCAAARIRNRPQRVILVVDVEEVTVINKVDLDEQDVVAKAWVARHRMWNDPMIRETRVTALKKLHKHPKGGLVVIRYGEVVELADGPLITKKSLQNKFPQCTPDPLVESKLAALKLCCAVSDLGHRPVCCAPLSERVTERV